MNSQAANGSPIDEQLPADRDAMSVAGMPLPRLDFTVVGIGASAGGLEAFSEFFAAMPPDRGLAFVLVQHLSPKRESMLAELLQKQTEMPVLQIDDGMAVEPSHVYVIRPGHTLTIRDGRLCLGESLLSAGHSRPVDDFFRSLAEEQRERAVAVILSGMGSNGTAGAQAIKVVGGVCVAQEPDSAKFPSMPRSLIDSHLADFVLRPNEMPETLLRLASNDYVSGGTSAEIIARRESHQIGEILAILRTRVRHDFAGYKKPTIVRRIQRRMSFMQQSSMADYARTLRQVPGEVISLADDLMIHVTGFFRDPDVWEGLRQKVILPLVAEKQDQATIRVWVTACASGEEAYTLAMLLVEAAEAVDKRFDVKIFATDMAERTLAHARAGLFAGGIESEVTPQRLARFFDKDDSMYRIKKELRELVVFAPQNVLQDPPFSRLDIATCRNLMIYLEPDVQQRVLAMLHFGLRDSGTLVLGNSETIGESNDLFEPIDKKLRIYRRIGPTRHGLIDFPLPRVHGRPVGDAGEIAELRTLSRVSLSQITNRALLDAYTPPAVVVDRHGRIVYVHGATERFLDPPRGEPTREILVLARDPVRGAVRVALHRAVETGDTTVVKDGLLPGPDGQLRAEVTVAPLDRRGMPGYFLVSFSLQPVAVEAAPAHANDSAKGEMADQLGRARDELQSTIEELQTANEEMKASNEEVTSVNEELQSANEELETSKEELQSLNEELTTVNGQLQAKMEELERSTNDLASLLSSTDIAVIFLDTQFCIRRFTPAVRKLIDLIPSDVGRPMSDLARKFVDPDLADDAVRVLETLVPVEREVRSEADRWYARRVLPYRTPDNRIEGVVVTFVDITDRRTAEVARRLGEDRLRVQSARTNEILESISDAFYVVNADYSFVYVNQKAEQLWRRRREDLIGSHCWTALPEFAGTEVQQFHEHAMRTREPVQFETTSPVFDGRWIDVSIYPESGGGLSCYFRDISDRKQSEQDRVKLLDAEQHARLAAENANAAKDQFLANASHELRTPLSAILLWSKLLNSVDCDDTTRREGSLAIERSAEAQQRLIEDLLDAARIASGKLRLELRPIDLTAVIAAAVETLRPAADAKDVRLSTDFGKNIGLVKADAERLQQVVWNLVSNAVKFTPAGGGVDVGLWRREDHIEVRVADDGQGIDPAVAAELFAPFRQADPSSTRRHGGLGLGLAISRQIVELHGGTITAHSDGPGRGSVFTVTLRLHRQAASRQPKAAETAIEGLAGVRIFLVEDDQRTREVVAIVLRRAGATVETFGHAEAVPAAWAVERPDLLISDIGLPDKDGHALMRDLRASEPADSPPVPSLAFTAFNSAENHAKATDSGFTDLLIKPVDPARLIQSLRHLLGR